MGILDGQSAIVTGAGQGVGRGIALALAGEGARIVVAGRTVSKCETVVAEIEERGGTAIAVDCDVVHRDQIEACINQTIDAFGQLDILVNNAQTMLYKSIRRTTDDEINSMWDSGPLASFRFMQLSFDHLRSSKGNVINIGSGSGIMPQPAMSGYAMAKESIRTLSRVGAVEWGRYGIRVNSICPLAESPGADTFGGDTGAYDAVTAQVPLGHWGDAESDIGRGAVYLAGPDAKYITGTTLMIDGGFNYLR